MTASQQNEPLIARPPSQNSSETLPGLEEEHALLTNRWTGKRPPSTVTSSTSTRRWREIGIFAWALVATAAVLILAMFLQYGQHDERQGDAVGDHDLPKEGYTALGKRNLIFMVSDGMGPTSLALTRSWKQYTDGFAYGDDRTLLLDEYLIGQSRTRSTSSLVTDSAAGATAFSCGEKSYNGAISVLPDHSPCGSVMEAAKRLGYTTGLVVTTRITDATPAVFISHARSRAMEDSIARQMVGETHPLGRMVDLMFGGGRCHFLGNSTEGSCRKDDIDIVRVAKNEGWNYINDRKSFDKIRTPTPLPLLGLFARTDFPYEIDRQHQKDVYPSLEEMTKTALEILDAATQHTEQGFFIMIEGSRIDHAGHANDPAAQVHEVLAYDNAMTAVLDFIQGSSTPTLMVSTSDHETGGLATARQLHSTYPEYLWYPGVLANVTHSASWAAHEYHTYLDSTSGSSAQPPRNSSEQEYLRSLLSRSLGINDGSTDEVDALLADPDIAAYTFADMISRRAQTGWSTHGHSGADVNIYASDNRLARPLVGNHENTDVGKFLTKFLSAEEEVEKVTQKLREYASAEDIEASSFLGPIPAESERLDGQDHLEHYTGDHRRLKRHANHDSDCGCGM